MFIPPNSGFVDRRSQLRSRRNDCASDSKTRTGLGLCSSDRRLAANEEPPLGAHLITPRFAYAHHGIYVGADAVVHYGALASPWRRGPVEEVSLSRFADGRPVWVRPAGPDALRREEIVLRARSRIGENRYRLLSNNCEHFSEWCVHGKHRSPQVERLLAQVCCVSQALRELMRWLSVVSPRHSGSPALSVASTPRVLCANSPRHSTRSSAGNPGCRPLSSRATPERAPAVLGGIKQLRGPLTRITC